MATTMNNNNNNDTNRTTIEIQLKQLLIEYLSSSSSSSGGGGTGGGGGGEEERGEPNTNTNNNNNNNNEIILKRLLIVNDLTKEATTIAMEKAAGVDWRFYNPKTKIVLSGISGGYLFVNQHRELEELARTRTRIDDNDDNDNENENNSNENNDDVEEGNYLLNSSSTTTNDDDDDDDDSSDDDASIASTVEWDALRNRLNDDLNQMNHILKTTTVLEEFNLHCFNYYYNYYPIKMIREGLEFNTSITKFKLIISNQQPDYQQQRDDYGDYDYKYKQQQQKRDYYANSFSVDSYNEIYTNQVVEVAPEFTLDVSNIQRHYNTLGLIRFTNTWDTQIARLITAAASNNNNNNLKELSVLHDENWWFYDDDVYVNISRAIRNVLSTSTSLKVLELDQLYAWDGGIILDGLEQSRSITTIKLKGDFCADFSMNRWLFNIPTLEHIEYDEWLYNCADSLSIVTTHKPRRIKPISLVAMGHQDMDTYEGHVSRRRLSAMLQAHPEIRLKNDYIEDKADYITATTSTITKNLVHSYYMNLHGRYLLDYGLSNNNNDNNDDDDDDGQQQQQQKRQRQRGHVPLSLWTLVLEKAADKPSVVYEFLRKHLIVHLFNKNSSEYE